MSVQSGNNSIVSQPTDDESAATTKSFDLVTSASVSSSKIHQSGSNVVGSNESRTNRSGNIGEDAISPAVNECGFSASMLVTPPDVHQSGLISVSSKDDNFIVKENNSMELSAANGSDNGLKVAIVTPMESYQSELILHTSEDKVIETNLIEWELSGVGQF